MKTKFIYLIVSIVLIFTGCKKEIEYPQALTTAKANLETAFNALDDQMATAAEYIRSSAETGKVCGAGGRHVQSGQP